MRRISRYFLLSLAVLCLISTGIIAQKPTVAAVVWDDRAMEGSDHDELRVYQLGDPVPGLKVTVAYEGTARDGFDYRCNKGTDWNVLEVDKYAVFQVKPILDGIVEGNEVVTIRIVEDEAYDIDPEHVQASLIIQDGDIPIVEFEASSSVHNESLQKAEVKVILSGASEEDVEIDFSVQGVLADEGEDYSFDSRRLVIPAGETGSSIRFRVMDDDVPEDEETVVIRMTGAKGASISTIESHYYTIRNDDGEPERSIIYDRMYGALLGFRAGCSMGAFTEYNWTQDRIQEIFGHVDSFHPFKHYGDTWTHPVGATEDGGERHKLICTAIMEKQDRIGYKDLKDVWLRDCELEDMYSMTQNYDRVLYAFARWGVPRLICP